MVFGLVPGIVSGSVVVARWWWGRWQVTPLQHRLRRSNRNACAKTVQFSLGDGGQLRRLSEAEAQDRFCGDHGLPLVRCRGDAKSRDSANSCADCCTDASAGDCADDRAECTETDGIAYGGPGLIGPLLQPEVGCKRVDPVTERHLRELQRKPAAAFELACIVNVGYDTLDGSAAWDGDRSTGNDVTEDDTVKGGSGSSLAAVHALVDTDAQHGASGNDDCVAAPLYDHGLWLGIGIGLLLTIGGGWRSVRARIRPAVWVVLWWRRRLLS